MRVLVLDDQPDKGLRRVLRTMGAVPLIARTEEEAIVIINAGIDAAIVDMQLELPLWNLCRAVGEYCTYECASITHRKENLGSNVRSWHERRAPELRYHFRRNKRPRAKSHTIKPDQRCLTF